MTKKKKIISIIALLIVLAVTLPISFLYIQRLYLFNGNKPYNKVDTFAVTAVREKKVSINDYNVIKNHMTGKGYNFKMIIKDGKGGHTDYTSLNKNISLNLSNIVVITCISKRDKLITVIKRVNH